MSSPADPAEPEGAFESLAETFFSSPPPTEIEVEPDAWGQPEMSAGNRRAMHATFVLLGCGAAAVLGYAALSEWFLVAPAELGGAGSQAALSGWSASAATHASESRAAVAVAREQLTRTQALAPRREEPALPEASPEVAEPVVASIPPQESPELVNAIARPARVRRARSGRPHAGAAPFAADASLTRRAYSALARGRAAEAEALAKRALAGDNTRAATYIVLAGARDALGNREGARAAFRDCVQRARDAQVSTCRTLAR